MDLRNIVIAAEYRNQLLREAEQQRLANEFMQAQREFTHSRWQRGRRAFFASLRQPRYGHVTPSMALKAADRYPGGHPTPPQARDTNPWLFFPRLHKFPSR